MAKISGPVGYGLNMTGTKTSLPSRITQRDFKDLPIEEVCWRSENIGHTMPVVKQ